MGTDICQFQKVNWKQKKKRGLVEEITSTEKRISKEKHMTNKIWKITDKGLDLVREYERKNTGGEFREFMKTYSPVLESGKTIKEEEKE